MGQKQKWIKFRHRVVRNIAYIILLPYSKIKYGITIDKFKEQRGRQYLIIMNHQTAFDQFFVGSSFKGPIYYLASEDLFSNGFISKLIRYLVAPIPIKKQTTDVRAVMNCIRVAKEGGTIALSPEGNRTYSGKTEYIKPAIIGLVRKLNLPLAIYRIEGGYGVHPRWSDVVRKGKMHSYVSKVIEPEEIRTLSDEELYSLIVNELYVNEAQLSGNFHHRKSAEYLERAIYVCPFCGLSTFESHYDIIECKKCGRRIKYLPTKELSGMDFYFPFRFVNDWYTYQCDFVNRMDITEFFNKPIFDAEQVRLSDVLVYKKKNLIDSNATITLYGNRIVITYNGNEHIYNFDDLSAVTVLGKNKLNIYLKDKIYQLKGDKRFNALKYVNIYHHYKNTKEGERHVEFLGL